MSALATIGRQVRFGQQVLRCRTADYSLSPNEEVTLRGVAIGIATPARLSERDLKALSVIEEHGGGQTFYWEPPTVTWANATHLALVEVDIASGKIEIDRYVVAHDCGVVINPMLVDGQIVGGTVQGLGGTLFEEFVYDRQGQLLTGSLMDYALPRAGDSPSVGLLHQESPSPLNPFGVKGVGEGGAIAPPAAIANAICDALATFKAEFNSTPIKPEHIVRAIATGDKSSGVMRPLR